MSKYLTIYENLIKRYGIEGDEEADELLAFLQSQSQTPDRPPFTEAGLDILEYLQTCGGSNLKAKDIADGMNIASRKVSGAIRKLCTDGYVEKMGQNPVIYNLTEQGKTVDIENYRATLVKE